MLPVGAARGTCVASALLVMLLLVSCGGADGGSGDRPTIAPTRTPTVTLPSPEPPSPTRSPDRTERPELPSPSRSPERTESPDEPAAQPSSAPRAPEPAPETPTPTIRETEEPAEGPADEAVGEPAADEGAPTWVWWLLAALVAGAVAVPLVVRARRRRTWRQAVVEQAGELAWFARELLPGLRRTGSREQVAGGWAVGRGRVAAAEDRLTVLESTAPDEAGRQRARSLRDASRQARAHMERLTGPVPQDTWALDLDAIIADLERALRTATVSAPE
ncbi:MAG TPA: hypothetical protein VFH10_02140 [Nocardioides sp.]|uniref:hypothetical protein n=1 Tax=Nocardioides sp. TaxID=35761 RepID=UPI002D81026E|nr:hypothetical protein [Nocardioides sp.]HET6651409.1 hypothetical protein [Nocardioides sp.]